MAAGRKFDYPSLLAPGGHHVTLRQIYRIAVESFAPDSAHRERLFHQLEEFVQATLRSGIPGDLSIDGSFLTKKPVPSDVDVVFTIDLEVSEAMTEEQQAFFTSINQDIYVERVDSFGVVRYPRGHKFFRTTLDAGNMPSHFGVENSEEWLKGYCVLMVRETNVGRRIRC